MATVVVRHGQTEWSTNGRHTSHTDLPLTEEGRVRAAALAPRLAEWDFSLVLTSPLLRARETCELAGLGELAVVDEDLQEWDYGEYEGLTTPEIREQNPEWVLWRDGCPGGEEPDQVGARADRVVDQLRDVDGHAVAFAHGHFLRVLTARWIEMPVAAGARFALSAAAISVLGHERETQVVWHWNDTELRRSLV
jgi:broad specificity phosphatase PhoE